MLKQGCFTYLFFHLQFRFPLYVFSLQDMELFKSGMKKEISESLDVKIETEEISFDKGSGQNCVGNKSVQNLVNQENELKTEIKMETIMVVGVEVTTTTKTGAGNKTTKAAATEVAPPPEV